MSEVDDAGDDIQNSFDRKSTSGFERILIDLHFLAHANYLVCTMSSNVCRLAYEMQMAINLDNFLMFKSLDTDYYNYFDMTLFKMAILENRNMHHLNFRRGDLILKRILEGKNFDGYLKNGLSNGRMINDPISKTYPSYKTIDFY